MRTMTIVAIATMLRRHRRLGKAQAGGSGTAPLPAKPLAARRPRAPHIRARNTGQAGSRIDSESRLRRLWRCRTNRHSTKGPRNRKGGGAELLDIAVRGGWPAIPARPNSCMARRTA